MPTSVAIFETERIRVRQFTLQDEEDFFKFNSDPQVMKYIRPPLNSLWRKKKRMEGSTSK